MERNEGSLRHLWDNVKCANIHTAGVPEGEEREKGPEKTSEDSNSWKLTEDGRGNT